MRDGGACAAAAFTLAIVGTINVMYFALGLPRWLWHGKLPLVPAPPASSPEEMAATGERACCKCWPPCAGGGAVVEATPTCTAKRNEPPAPDATATARTATPSAARRKPAFVHRCGTMHGIQYEASEASAATPAKEDDKV